MLSQYAWKFFLLSQFLEDICHRLGVRIVPAAPVIARALEAALPAPITGETPVRSLRLPDMDAPDQWLNKDEQEDVRRILNLLNGACKEIGVLGVDKEIQRIVVYLSYKKKSDLFILVKALSDRIADELESVLFIHVDKEKSRFYRSRNLFGDEIGAAFPKIEEDIANAGTCYALGMNTACVFHLMRVMEHCVQRLGRKLRVSIDPGRETWHQIMLHVHGKVAEMPGGQKFTRAQNSKKQNFSMAAARLDHVRIVWRNDVMHPKATYDQAEALEVLTGVEAFLKSVAGLL